MNICLIAHRAWTCRPVQRGNFAGVRCIFFLDKPTIWTYRAFCRCKHIVGMTKKTYKIYKYIQNINVVLCDNLQCFATMMSLLSDRSVYIHVSSCNLCCFPGPRSEKLRFRYTNPAMASWVIPERRSDQLNLPLKFGNIAHSGGRQQQQQQQQGIS